MRRAIVGLLAMSLMTPVLSATTSSGAAASAKSLPVKQYVALAYSSLYAPSVFIGYSNALSAAKSASLKLCQTNIKKGCRGAVWVYNGWAAYASVRTPRGGNGFAYGATESFVTNLSMHWCQVTKATSDGGGGCQLRAVVKTTPLNPHKIKGGTW